MTDLWSEAARDQEAEDRAFRMEMAKSAAEGTWTFLALAQSKEEFSDRYALAAQSMARIAKDTGVSAGDVGQLMIDRFALLMEAKGNPFDKDDDGDSDADDQDDADESGDHDAHDTDSDHGDGDSDQDDSDDDEDEEDSDKDDSHVDDAGTDDSDDNGADGDDDHEQDDDGDDNADRDDAGEHKDDDQDDDMDGRTAPFGGLYSHLMARITSGEDVSTWGRRPFAGSLVASFGDGADPVSDENVPTPDAPSAPGGTGFGSNTPLTTKPRQMPGGSQQLSEPPGGSAFDPAMNGGDIDAGEDSAVTAKLDAKRAFIADEVQLHNPGLTAEACLALADQVVERYLKTAEDLSPLLYGDRSNVPDGPLTDKVKNWSPPNLPGKKPPSDEGSDSGGDEGGDGGDPQGENPGGGPPELNPGTGAEAVEGGGEGAAAIGGAGEAAGAGSAIDLLPLLAL